MESINAVALNAGGDIMPRGDERKGSAGGMCAGSATPCGTSYNIAVGYQYLGGTKRSFWEDSMLSLRVRPLLALCAVAAELAFAVTDADARAGRRRSLGRRRSRTFSAPPSTPAPPGPRPPG